MNILFQLWDFIKILGLLIIIVFLIGVLFAIFSAIYDNIVTSIVKRKLIKRLKKDIVNMELDKISIEDLREDNEK